MRNVKHINKQFKEDCPNPTFKSFLETDLRVYQVNQGHVVISHKGHGPDLVSFVNDRGRWFAGSIVDGVRVNKGDYNYAPFIHDQLALLNMAIANNHLEVTS
tara:strand:+ start:5387 stop:5692 length:306 start_codon:yes stop_codon:yes gene_type:complete